jgi:hypothetical protein
MRRDGHVRRVVVRGGTRTASHRRARLPVHRSPAR